MFRNLFVWVILVVTAVAGLRHYTFNHTAQYNYGNTSKTEQLDYVSIGNRTRVDHKTEEKESEDRGGEKNSVGTSFEVENPFQRDGIEAIETPPIGNIDDNVPDSATGCAIEVHTNNGPVRGHDFQLNPSICAYIDIPYGKIEGRFQAPLEADPWTEAHEEREHTKICPQILNEDRIIGDENCLVLSIFTSKEIEDVPVLFHIHDGNFNEGSGDPAMFGPEFIVPRGVVLVLPNFRVGPLGYLCLRNSTAPGNAALKDLTLALRWVNDNIQQFGGDPTKITISGDGKAGALASLLALSPQSRNLFTKAITESGSVLSPWAIDRHPVEKGLKLGNMLCEDDDECKSPYESLEEAPLSSLLTISFKNEFKFVPCIEMDTEDAFLTETPWSILKSNIMNTTFLVGSADRSGMHEALMHNSATLEHLNKDRESLLPADLVFDDSKDKTEATNDITTLYFEDEDITEERKDELTKYYTDALYLGPSVRMARALVAAGATVYLYEFSYVGGLNRERNTLSVPVEGAARGDLSGYLFAQEDMKPDEEDENMINFIMELWISFMRTG
ncbi:Venom carboxylesterase-6 [Eumeta japonica]|uniref:Venom carboxylesterase-6 n=1 Tax=Eumeta variegata TaxID=151549 RepID=A0A4C1X5I4_EUMVA|nr:Venom carboxylesterase-6 [Eumeta japonica]